MGIFLFFKSFYTLASLFYFFSISFAQNYTLNKLSFLSIIPQANLKSNVSILDGLQTIKTEAFANYFYRLDSDGYINVWDVSNPNTSLLICSITAPYPILDFAVDNHYGDFAYIDSNKNVNIFNPLNCTLNASLTLNYSTLGAGIFLSYTYVIVTFGFKNAEREQNRVFRYYRKNLTYTKVVNYNFKSQQISGNLRYSYCVKPRQKFGIAQFILTYNQSSYLFNYGHWNNSDIALYWPQAKTASAQNNISWSIKSITWDFDCGFIYVVHKPPLNKITILYHVGTKFMNQVTFPLQIMSATSFDQKKWFLTVFLSNNSMIFYNVSSTTTPNSNQGKVGVIDPLQFLFQKQTYRVQTNNLFARTASKYFVSTQNYTQVYKVQCPSGITLGMGLCLNALQDEIKANQNSQYLIVLYSSIKAVAYMILFMQVTPLACVFLRFINFWTICSIYSMVKINTKQPLTSILYEIYKLINTSLFDILGISFKVQISNEEKVVGSYSNLYGITSNFAPIIIEPITQTLFMCLILYIFEWTKHKYFSENYKKKFHISKLKIFFGQYVSFLSVFMFPLKFVYKSMNHLETQEKINLTFHIFFFLIGLMMPFHLIFLNTKKISSITRTEKKLITISYFTQKSITKLESQFIQQYSSVITFQYLEFSFICVLNIVMPILGTVQCPYWFAFICGMLIIGQIIIDSKRSQWRINSILLSSQLLVFHICFCMELIDFSENTKYIISMIGLGTIIFGALHQVISLALRIIVDLYVLFCKRTDIKVKDQKQNNQKFVKQFIQINSNFAHKQYYKKQESTQNLPKRTLKLKRIRKNSLALKTKTINDQNTQKPKDRKQQIKDQQQKVENINKKHANSLNESLEISNMKDVKEGIPNIKDRKQDIKDERDKKNSPKLLKKQTILTRKKATKQTQQKGPKFQSSQAQQRQNKIQSSMNLKNSILTAKQKLKIKYKS